MRTKFLLSIFILLSTLVLTSVLPARDTFAQARESRLVRDTEIENTIRVYTAPIFEVAALDPSAVRIQLVQNPTLNAFVAGGQQIFIHTGLLMRAETPEEVIGVLAHETGHITGGHLARFGQGLEDAQNASLAAMLLGIPAAVLAGRGDVAAAAISLGAQVGTRSLLQYTRGMEQSADQAAVDFLDEAGISSKGLMSFMQTLQREEALYTNNQNPYIRTHPLSSERIRFYENHYRNSPIGDREMDPLYYSLHERMQAKLHGYIDPPVQTYRRYPDSDQSVPARYARAIANMRESKTDEALVLISGLIEDYPDDPFFLELKGEIARDGGRLDAALDPYRKAVEILPWAALIRRNLAQTLIELNNPDYEEEAEQNLRAALRYEPWMASAWRLLATLYGRRGDFANAALAQAEEAIHRNDKGAALSHARRAMEMLPNGSPGWLRAQDIEVQAARKEG